MENTECLIVKAHNPVIVIKVSMSLTCITALGFVSSSSNVPSKEASLLALHFPKSRTKALYNTYHKSSPMRLWRKKWSTKENKAKLRYNHDASVGAAVGN